MKKLDQYQRYAKEFLNSDSGCAKATKIIFALLLVAGALTVTAMAPNIISIFKKTKRFGKYSDQQIKSALYGLKRRNLVKFIKEDDDAITIKLNYDKEPKIKKFIFDVLSISKPKAWDKKWRVLIFDVPVNFNRARQAMTLKLRELGFYQLQKSVWLHPFPCEDEILFVASIFNIEEFINILVVEKILKEADIKKFFKL